MINQALKQLRKELINEVLPKEKDLLGILREKIKLEHPFQHFSSVLISNPNERIKGIAISNPNNLITDQFGTWLAGFLRQPVGAAASVSMTETGGVTKTINVWHSTTNFNDTINARGSRVQVGSGSTAATRADYDVETAFGTAPESSPFVTGAGSYAAGAIGVSGSISAGGAGTIAETCLFGYIGDDTATVFDFLYFHDILGSTEAFVAAQTITVAYTINL